MSGLKTRHSIHSIYTMFDPTKTWLGFGNKSGGIVMTAGLESVTGQLWNLDSMQSVGFDYTNARLGLGLGGTVASLVIVAAFNCPNANNLRQIDTSDWGIGVAIGGKWPTLISSLRRYRVLKRVLRLLESSAAVRIGANDIDELRNLGSVLYSTYDVASTASEPKMITLDVPMAGYSVELSAAYSFGTKRINIYP